MKEKVKCDHCDFIEERDIVWSYWVDDSGSGYGHHRCNDGQLGTFRLQQKGCDCGLERKSTNHNLER